MRYRYEERKSWIFTDEGQRQFLRVRDNVGLCLKRAGAVRMQEAVAGETGVSWDVMACVDRLVELGELRELTDAAVPGQHRVFVANR